MPLITPADTTLRGQPWLTYVLALVLVGAFWSQRIETAPARERSAASIAEATAQFEENPTVALDLRFEEVLGTDWVENARSAYVQRLRDTDRPLLSGFLQRRQQEQFDELEQLALIDLHQLPAFRNGVTDRRTPVENYWKHLFVNESGFYLGVAIFFLLAAGAAVECSFGMPLFGLLCVTAVGTAAGASISFYDELARPWVGATGLLAGLLGASVVCSLRRPPLLLGAVPLPGLLMFPLFVATEFMRLGGPSGIGQAQIVPPAAAAGACLLLAGAVALLKPVRKGNQASGSSERVLDAARKAVLSHHPERAIELLSEEFARKPANLAVALSLWNTSRDHGDPAEVSEAMLVMLREHVRRGRSADVAACWTEFARVLPDRQAEAPLLVRVGQSLLDEGEADEALCVLTAAVDQSDDLSSGLLLKVIRVARDLDPALARRAAETTLPREDLSETDRQDLKSLLGVSPTTDEAGNPLPRIELVQQRVPAPEDLESGAAAATAGWQGTQVEDLSSELADSAHDPEAAAPSSQSKSEAEANSATPAVQAIDPGDLDPNALRADSLSDEVGEAEAASPEAMEQWNDPGLIDPEMDDLAGDTQELKDTRPIEAPPSEPPAAEDLGESRPLKLREAVLLGCGEQGLSLEIGSRGKISLPYERIDALSVVAVKGLGPKPVLLIDLVINWMSLTQEPLRVIRVRSDQFDPRQLVPGLSSASEALRAFLSNVFRASDATPLPDAQSAHGTPFREFESLTDYHHEVLMVDGEVEPF